MTSDRYVEMLRNFCEPKLRFCGIDPSSVWFQQDGASMSVLQEMFPQHVISRGGDVPCPAHSLDLSACGHFLWRYLRSNLFISEPRTLEEQKQRIKE
jgi:hypothetical protein